MHVYYVLHTQLRRPVTEEENARRRNYRGEYKKNRYKNTEKKEEKNQYKYCVENRIGKKKTLLIEKKIEED
jgi:hypothetical protein